MVGIVVGMASRVQIRKTSLRGWKSGSVRIMGKLVQTRSQLSAAPACESQELGAQQRPVLVISAVCSISGVSLRRATGIHGKRHKCPILRKCPEAKGRRCGSFQLSTYSCCWIMTSLPLSHLSQLLLSQKISLNRVMKGILWNADPDFFPTTQNKM